MSRVYGIPGNILLFEIHFGNTGNLLKILKLIK